MIDDPIVPYQLAELEGKPSLQPNDPDHLGPWIALYLAVHVVGGPSKTTEAKTNDLRRFYTWYEHILGHDLVDAWTPSVTKTYRIHLTDTIQRTGRPFAPATVNRHLATLRTFVRWLNGRRPLLAGDPMVDVTDVNINFSAWRGLTDVELARLRSAVDQRKAIWKSDSRVDADLEVAVFYVLVHTGLRAAELCALDRTQLTPRGLRNVRRKAGRVQEYLPLPTVARRDLDHYLATRTDDHPALFIGRRGHRLTTVSVRRICQRIAQQANAPLPVADHIHLTPHMLRHAFLKRVADKHGVHVAQRFSGNATVRHVMRYVKPSDEELGDMSEDLF